MNDNTPPSDIDDNEILDKFNGLLEKYQNRGESPGTARRIKSTVSAKHYEETGLPIASPDTIPTLTEAVTLHPAIIQRQPKRSTPIQKLLDAALEETGITMNARDRKALANALESRLTGR